MRSSEFYKDPDKNTDLRSLMRTKAVVIRAFLKLGFAQNSVKLDLSTGVYGGTRHNPSTQTDPPGASPDFELPDDSYKRIGM